MDFSETWQHCSHGDPSYMRWLLCQKVKVQDHIALEKNFNQKLEQWPQLFAAFIDFNETWQSYSHDVVASYGVIHVVTFGSKGQRSWS